MCILKKDIHIGFHKKSGLFCLGPSIRFVLTIKVPDLQVSWGTWLPLKIHFQKCIIWICICCKCIFWTTCKKPFARHKSILMRSLVISQNNPSLSMSKDHLQSLQNTQRKFLESLISNYIITKAVECNFFTLLSPFSLFLHAAFSALNTQNGPFKLSAWIRASTFLPWICIPCDRQFKWQCSNFDNLVPDFCQMRVLWNSSNWVNMICFLIFIPKLQTTTINTTTISDKKIKN